MHLKFLYSISLVKSDVVLFRNQQLRPLFKFLKNVTVWNSHLLKGFMANKDTYYNNNFWAVLVGPEEANDDECDV